MNNTIKSSYYHFIHYNTCNVKYYLRVHAVLGVHVGVYTNAHVVVM